MLSYEQSRTTFAALAGISVSENRKELLDSRKLATYHALMAKLKNRVLSVDSIEAFANEFNYSTRQVERK